MKKHLIKIIQKLCKRYSIDENDLQLSDSIIVPEFKPGQAITTNGTLYLAIGLGIEVESYWAGNWHRLNYYNLISNGMWSSAPSYAMRVSPQYVPDIEGRERYFNHILESKTW